MIEGADLELFEQSLRQVVERNTGAALDAALIETGWLDALETDPLTASAVLFPIQGETNATSVALTLVVAAGLGLQPSLAQGVVFPVLGSWSAPGVLQGGTVAVRGLTTTAILQADDAVIATETGIVSVPSGALTTRAIDGIDPDFGLVEVTGDSLRCSASGENESWDRAVLFAQLALAHEIVGASRRMLELARQHSLDRLQFGQPIARFQAVRHRLAETLVAIESADGVLAAARDCPSPELAAIGKALAGRGARIAARHCQQVLAGIGFTAEHPFQMYYRRILVLDQLFGSSKTLTEQLGAELLARRKAPALLPL